jgi:hypothetical protein
MAYSAVFAPPRRVSRRHPTALLAACGLATGAAERNDSELLQSLLRRLLAREWKTAAEVSPVRLDAALAAAAEVAFTMAGDQAEWRYSTAAAWARRAVTEAAGEDILEAVGRLLPRLLQRHAHEVTWVHAAVQEFLVTCGSPGRRKYSPGLAPSPPC